MILTCPSCATRYLIDSAALGNQGRMVRCASCSHSWWQRPPEDAPRRVDVAPPPEEVRPLPPGSNLPAFHPPNRGRMGAVAWVVLLAAVLGVLAAGYFGRGALVAAWPPAAPIYAAIGLPLPGPQANLRLFITNQEFAEEEGTRILLVEGEIANDSRQMVELPLLRGILVDQQAGEELQSWTFEANEVRLFPGDVGTFRSRIRNPSPRATFLQIVFVDPS